MKKAKRGCGCYAMSNRCPCISLIYSMNAKSANPYDDFETPITKFSSRNFNGIFLTGDFPTNVQYSDLDDSDNFEDMKDSIRDNVDRINDNGGFKILGWYKKGVIEDSASKSVGEGEQVVSGELMLHTVSIKPFDETAVSVKYDVSKLTDASTYDEF